MELTKISNDELAFHSLSFNDENGRLFEWQGNIYRAISPRQTSLYQNLLEQKVIEKLVNQNLLIDTEFTPLKVENYEIVLQHRRINFVSYPQEWCGAMLKDAALLHLDLCIELDRYGLITGDANPLNVLFDGCQPVFVDLGSIEKISPDKHAWWSASNQFYRSFVNPLRLMSQDRGRIARWLMHDYEQGVLFEDVAALDESPSNLLKKYSRRWLKSMPYNLSDTILPLAKKIRNRTKSILSADSNQHPSRQSFYRQIRQEVVDIEPAYLPLQEKDFDYEAIKSSFKLGDRAERLRAVESTLSILQPATVLVMGNNDSDDTYAKLAAKSSQVVFFSPNEENVTQIYSNSKQDRLPILPLLINFASPSCDLSNDWYKPASDRLKCDLVIAVEIIDWLVFRQYLPFDRIAERLAMFCDRWLLVEFVIPQTIDTASLSPDFQWIFFWYTLDNFIEALSKKFDRVDITDRYSQGSVLLLCSK